MADLTDRAAEILCNSSPQAQRWATLGDAFRNVYRARINALIRAGYITDPCVKPTEDPYGRPLGGALERDARLLAANVCLDLTGGSVDNGTRGYWCQRVDEAYLQLAKFGRADDIPEEHRG